MTTTTTPAPPSGRGRSARGSGALAAVAVVLALAAGAVWLRSPAADAPTPDLPPAPAVLPPGGRDAAPPPDGDPAVAPRVAPVGVRAPSIDVDGPGQRGTAVLAGHVDSRTQGRGALYELRDLAIGDPVEVVLADGTVQRWRVTAVRQYPKATLPYDEVFTRAGAPRLALITCGGEFDRTERSYLDNIVAYAEPDPSAPS